MAFQQAMQMPAPDRETLWKEARSYVEFLHSHVDQQQSKESFYELYNTTARLLKTFDLLDPDAGESIEVQLQSAAPGLSVPMMPPFYMPPFFPQAGQASPAPGPPDPKSPLPTPPVDPTAQNQLVPSPYGQLPGVGTPFNAPGTMPYFFSAPGFANPFMMMGMPMATPSPEEKPEPEGKKGRARRRRQPYSSRRNLQCQMCGVTETPEWRRGPAGDHTLCNACGLHYAKSVRRQREQALNRNPNSLDMLLNEGKAAGEAAAKKEPEEGEGEEEEDGPAPVENAGDASTPNSSSSGSSSRGRDRSPRRSPNGAAEPPPASLPVAIPLPTATPTKDAN